MSQRVHLEQGQLELLERLVAAEGGAPEGQRGNFLVRKAINQAGATFHYVGGGKRIEVPGSEMDAEILANKGFLVKMTNKEGDILFCLLPEAYEYCRTRPQADVRAEEAGQAGPAPDLTPMPDPHKVFVVHGRNPRLRDEFFSFLRALELCPVEWSQVIRLTRKASPHVDEVLDAAFSHAGAVVVLLTPDDEVRLAPRLCKADEQEEERAFQFQARPNVLFEAGMAMGRNPSRTLLVQVGPVKKFCDIGSRHVIHLTNEPESRSNVADRLWAAGCSVNTAARDWLRTGDFSVDTNQAAGGSAPPRTGADEENSH